MRWRENKTPAFTKKPPNGVIPVVRHCQTPTGAFADVRNPAQRMRTHRPEQEAAVGVKTRCAKNEKNMSCEAARCLDL
jgi:hypothetical protein